MLLSRHKADIVLNGKLHATKHVVFQVAQVSFCPLKAQPAIQSDGGFVHKIYHQAHTANWSFAECDFNKVDKPDDERASHSCLFQTSVSGYPFQLERRMSGVGYSEKNKADDDSILTGYCCTVLQRAQPTPDRGMLSGKTGSFHNLLVGLISAAELKSPEIEKSNGVDIR
jgi:hypothetical protein